MRMSYRSIARKVAMIVFAGVPSLFLAGLATAAVSDEAAPSVTVRYHDLNLNDPEGVAVLYGRIRRAADEVCHPLDGGDPMRAVAPERVLQPCRRESGEQSAQ